MAEYTYKDVIIDPEDPRVEIGKEYIFGRSPVYLLERLNGGKAVFTRLKDADVVDYEPFYPEGEANHYPICIRKKEPEKKYVPFDLTNDEDRAKLRGAWVRYREIPNIEKQISGLNAACVFLYGMEDQGLSPEEMAELWEFVDGSPCGRLVEEDE